MECCMTILYYKWYYPHYLMYCNFRDWLWWSLRAWWPSTAESVVCALCMDSILWTYYLLGYCNESWRDCRVDGVVIFVFPRFGLSICQKSPCSKTFSSQHILCLFYKVSLTWPTSTVTGLFLCVCVSWRHGFNWKTDLNNHGACCFYYQCHRRR